MSFIPHDLRRSTGVLSNHHDDNKQRDETRDYYGKGRLTERNDAALPPIAASAIQALRHRIYSVGKGRPNLFTRSLARLAAEQKMVRCDRRVVDVRAKADGDVYIAVPDATGGKLGIVVVELPAKPQWCE